MLFKLEILALVIVPALGRELWLERDNKPVYLYPRSFDHQNPVLLTELRQACPGEICGVLSGAAVLPLLAAAPACSQQDMADKIIDAALKFDSATKAKMINIAIKYRKLEKNTAPDFTFNPPKGRNSLFCRKAPKHKELAGLKQAQDKNNDPNLFVDPTTGKTIKKGERADTFAFGTSQKSSSKSSSASCPSKDSTSSTAKKTDTTQSKTINNAKDIGNFGSCSIPQIDFGAGFDGRRETAYRPTDSKSYPHGSAQNIAVITEFICLSLTNTCKADDKAKATCAKAQDAANAKTKGTGEQADAFNAVFGITTHLADEAVVDNTGRVVSGGSTSKSTSNGIGDVGRCSVPQIDFGPNFDGRKETSFQPHDKSSYNHGSAQNIGVISQFICDRLKDTCGADDTVLATCQKATQAAGALPGKTGKQADAFNKVWGINTEFSKVAVLDDHGNVVG